MSMMVESVLLFDGIEHIHMNHLLEALIREGWTMPERGGEYTYRTGEGNQKATDIEEVMLDLDSTETGHVTVEKDSMDVTIGYVDRMPVNPLAGLQLHTWETDIQPSTDGSCTVPTRTYLSAITTAVTELTPRRGYGTFPDNLLPEMIPNRDEVVNGRFSRIFWLNVFGPQDIDAIGRDQIESAPAWLVQRLGPDHVLLVTHDNPVHPSGRWEDGREEVSVHFGI